MRCNCESLKCPVCRGEGCQVQAGARHAMYVGALCDGCAQHTPAQYMLADAPTSTDTARDGIFDDYTGPNPGESAEDYAKYREELEKNPQGD
jgi:hypothetical protein